MTPIQPPPPTTINNFVPENKVAQLKEAVLGNRINYDINLNSKEFEDVVNQLVKEYEFDEIIETGTFNGLGSTSVFAKTGKYVFTMECNRNNYERATSNLQGYDNVCVFHALSLGRQHLIEFMLKEEFDIDTTYDSDYPKSFYMREINQDVVLENALEIFCNNNRKQLIFLDSAGGVGYAEYKNIIQYTNQVRKMSVLSNSINGSRDIVDTYYDNKILILDDISHIKHKRSVEDLEIKGYEVHKSKQNRFAWCDLSKGKLKKVYE